MKSRSRTSHRLLVPALFALVAGCGGHRSGTTIVITEPEVVEEPEGPIYEIEPNDHASTADFIGEIRAGDLLTIAGHVTECCPDPYDGFAFFAAEPVDITITLTELDLAADLDFCIYDPVLDEIIACWETDSHPEVGVFAIEGPGDFHIVIASYTGDSYYELELDVRPLILPSTFAGDGVRIASTPAEETRRRFDAYRVPAASKARALLIDRTDQELILPFGPAGTVSWPVR